MASTYSTNLKIELQATGENSGTWGTITNTNLGTALEQAIVGYGNPNYASDANLTLTYTDTNAAQAARALVLNVTSGVSLTGTRELVVPTIQKQYIVQNNTTGSQSITVKTSAGTGITVPNGRKAHLYVDGTNVIYMDDFVDINGGSIDGTTIGANSAAAGNFTTVDATNLEVTNLKAKDGTAAGSIADSTGVVTLGSSVLTTTDINGGTIDGTTIGANSAAAGTFTSATVSTGNLTFSSTGQRITGDMSNATQSNRLSFQSSTTNGNTAVHALPNGTSQISAFNVLNNSDPTNASLGQLQITSTEVRINSSITGTGTQLPMIFAVGGERVRIDTSGNVAVGTTNAGTAGVSLNQGYNLSWEQSATESIPNLFRQTSSGALVMSVGYKRSATANGFASSFGSSLAKTAISLGTTAGAITFYTDTAATTAVGTDVTPTERMRINSSGNVGIGTASPSLKLTIADTTNQLSLTTGTNELIARASSTEAALYTFQAIPLNFYTNNALRATIDSSGNVGIGTASPGSKLDVSSSSQNIVLSRSTGGYAAFQRIAPTGQQVYDFYTVNNVEVARITADGSNFLTFSTGSSATERMRIDSSGNVGIGGTADAYAKTQIKGNLPTSGGTSVSYDTQAVITSAATSNAIMYESFPSVQNASFTLPSLYHFLAGQGTKGASATITSQAGFFVDSSLTGATNNYGFYSNIASGSNRFNFYANGTATNYFAGDVGIGTTSPTARVHAYSATTMKQLTVDGVGGIMTGINFANGGTTYGQIFFDNNSPYDMSVMQQYVTGSLRFGTNNTERARITAGGFFKASNTGTYASSTDDRHELRSDKNDISVIVGTTSTGANVVNVYSSFPASPNAGAYHFAGVISGSGYQFTVDADGDVKNTNNSYAAISDLKLKQDIEDAASQWDDIKSVRVRKYRFKRTPDAPLQIGVIAQELEQTSPGLVSEDADRDDENNELGTTTKSVKYSILYMKAIKALQEAMARIEQLEAKVAVLENK